jgi:cell division protein FtsQ
MGGALFYFAVFSPNFQIQEIKISGNQKIPAEDIENSIRERVSQKLLFFPTKSIFLIDSDGIVSQLLEKFPQIEKINLKRKLPATLIAKIQERLLIAVWCQNEECFSIDKTGVIFERSSPDSGLIIKSPEVKEPPLLGQIVIEENLLQKIFGVRGGLTNLKIGAKEFIVLQRERTNIKTLEGWEIYFNPAGDINWQLTKLRLVLEKEVPPERRKDLEYIDIRFGNFAPYKYRE